jgi:hypothetical protein
MVDGGGRVPPLNIERPRSLYDEIDDVVHPDFARQSVVVPGRGSADRMQSTRAG